MLRFKADTYGKGLIFKLNSKETDGANYGNIKTEHTYSGKKVPLIYIVQNESNKTPPNITGNFSLYSSRF